ncbi:unnamed protein product, partial [Rotaria sp. Silwood2]
KLISEDRTRMTYSDKLAKLIITTSIRADTGRYLIRLVNDSSEETGDCEVIVLGPPSIPRSSLEVKGVTKSKITNYLVEKRDKNSSDWVRCAETVNSAKVTIEKLKEEHEYEFRVAAENAKGLSEPLEIHKAVLVKIHLNPYVQQNELNLEKYEKCLDFDKSQQILEEKILLVCQQAFDYLVRWSINIGMDDDYVGMARVSNQALIIQFILKLIEDTKCNPIECTEAFFKRLDIWF